MRKVVLYTLLSLDGAVDDPDRFFARNRERAEVPEFDSAMVDNEEKIIAAQDAVLLGRNMYDNGRGSGQRRSTSRSPVSSTTSRSTW